MIQNITTDPNVCPPTDPNALTKCISAALVASDNRGVLGCATLLPDTPENAVTKCISAGLLANDNIAVFKCAKGQVTELDIHPIFYTQY